MTKMGDDGIAEGAHCHDDAHAYDDDDDAGSHATCDEDDADAAADDGDEDDVDDCDGDDDDDVWLVCGVLWLSMLQLQGWWLWCLWL